MSNIDLNTSPHQAKQMADAVARQILKATIKFPSAYNSFNEWALDVSMDLPWDHDGRAAAVQHLNTAHATILDCFEQKHGFDIRAFLSDKEG